MKRSSLFILVALLVSAAAPAWANDDGSFTVAGTVAAVHCSELGCEVELEVAAKGEAKSAPGRVRVSCADGEVAAACRMLLPGDEALITGRKQLTAKEASHVALLLTYLQERAGAEPQPAPVWLKMGQRVRYEGLWIQFQEVVLDTRCPTDVVCPWEGECTVAVGFWKVVNTPGDIFGTYLGTHHLTWPGATEVTVEDYLVRLGNLYPEPRSDLPPPEPADCFLLVEVEEVME